MKTDSRRTLRAAEETTLLPFLLGAVKGKSRNAVKNLLTHRQVLVDGKVVTRHDAVVGPENQITLLPPDAPAPAALPFPICYEDEHLLAVEKPAGLLTVSAGQGQDRTVWRMVGDYVKIADPEGRVFVVHRLDQDTSGLLLLAKSLEAKERLQKNWDTAVKERGYLAVVAGRPPQREDVVRSWLRETRTHLVYSVDSPCKDGKEAITGYQVLKGNDSYTLLELFLQTGRKNQIRVHMRDLGCPVVGDKRYGGPKSPIGRLCLHAHKLTFIHPLTGQTIALRSRKPRDFNRLFREA